MSRLYLKNDHELFHCQWLDIQKGETQKPLSYHLALEQLNNWRTKGSFQVGNTFYLADELTLSKTLTIVVLYLDNEEPETTSNLEVFNLANAVFDACNTQTEICLHGVKFVKDVLGIDRAGVLLLSKDQHHVIGTWGTNENGDIVEESDLYMPLEHNHWMKDSLNKRGMLIVKEDVELTSYSDVVGRGWNAIVSIYHGNQPLGWLCCDNLINAQPLTYQLKSQITHFGTMLGQWLIRSRNEIELRRLNENLEKEVQQKTKDLQKTIDQLMHTQYQLVQTERTKALSTFTAGVAHEINNPIGFIRSNLSFIGKVSTKVLEQMSELDLSLLDKSKSMLGDIDQVIDESVEGLDRVKNIISMLQPLNKLADEKPQQFDILQAVEFAVMGLETQPDSIQVNSSLTETFVLLPLQIFTLAIEHVLENSIDATKQVKDPSIVITLSTNDTHLLVSCADNGHGISSANIESIFLPFFTTKAPGSGLGLGLSLSQSLIQLANGNMKVTSIETKETVMTIEFEKGVLLNV